MSDQAKLGGTFNLGGDLPVQRMGYGAMRLAGPGGFGPPADPEEAVRVLRTAVDLGINHIDTSDFYGPYVVNQLIRDTLKPYRDNLVLVTKVGVLRTADKVSREASTPAELRQAVEENLTRLGLDVLDVVNLRVHTGARQGPTEGSLASKFETMLELQREGKLRHIGLSNVTLKQLEEALAMGPVACVQNNYGLLNRADDPLLATCARRGSAFVPFFPLGGGLRPLAEAALNTVADEVGASAHQVALAWLLQRGANVLLIPGTSKVTHLRENIAAAEIRLSQDQVETLDRLV